MKTKKFWRFATLVLFLVLAFENQSSAEEFCWPVPGYDLSNLTCTYRYSNGDAHSTRYCRGNGWAIDIGIPVGTEVLAPAAGIVRNSQYETNSGFGNCIEIEHKDGTFTLYGHLSERLVNVGDNVNRGDVIAYSGNTGNSSGPHLHFEIKNVDVYEYFRINGCRDPREFDDGISIADTFPDGNFRSYIKNNFDTNGDSHLNDSEIANVTEIKVANSGISDLTGIKTFYNLSWLECNNNSIKTLDLSGMKKLTSIWCWENSMESLNVSGCTELPCIWAKDNNLKTLNVEGCNKLDTIYAWNNGFTSLTVNKLPKLRYLNIAGCKYLRELNCSSNVLTELYFNDCTSLEIVDCRNNKLSSIDNATLTTCPKLQYLWRDSNVQLSGVSAPVITTSSLPNATVGKEYYAKVNASGTGIITYTLSSVAKSNGFLCDGNEPYVTGCTSGIINGIPKYERDSLTFTVKATNFVGYASKTFTITITPQIAKPVITTSNSSQIEAITKRSLFLQDDKTFEGFTATGDNITWSISKGKLPVGLSLNSSTGKFVGTPDYTEEGKTSNRGVSYTFSVTATNGGGSDTKEFTMNVFESPIITTTGGALKDGYVGEAYSANINATGSNTFMLWDIESGAFPNGLDFDVKQMGGNMSAGPRKAIIAGTPTRAGKYPFKVTVMSGTTGKAYYMGLIKITDNKNPGEYATKDFSIQIADKPVIDGEFSVGTEGRPYSNTVEVKGGFSPYSWTTYSTMPAGLKILRNGSKFTLYGTPEKAGDYPFTIKLADKNGKSVTKTFTIKIMPKPVLNGELQNGVINASYSGNITVSGGASPYTWTPPTNLPDGLSFTSSGATATISGKPEKAGTFNFTLTATDNNGATASKSFTLTVTEPVISGTFNNGVINAAYNGSAKVSGGTSPYTWKYTGKLPQGLDFSYSDTDATLSGTPEEAGTFNFTLTATDKNGAVAEKDFSIKVTKPKISGTLETSGVIKKVYSSALKVSGGTAPYTWEDASNVLPAELKLVPNSTGTKLTIKGKPKTAKKYTFTLKVTDANKATASKKFSIKITKPTISGTLTASGVIKATYSSSLKVSGGTAPYTWEDASNVLPAELKLVPNSNGTKLTIKGKPKTAKKYTFTLKVTDANKAAVSKKFTITITKPAISGTLKTTGVVKTAYSSSVTVKGGTAPYTWTKSSGTLPSGLKLVPNSTGTKLTIKGKPKTAKKYTFTLKVTDKNKATASKKFTVTISKAAETSASKTQSAKKDTAASPLSTNNLIADDGITAQVIEESSNAFVIATTPLYVISEDILWQGEGRDEDLVDVKADKPVNFIIGEWADFNGRKVEVSDAQVYINDEPAEDILISEENTFTIPAEMIQGDFRIYVKAQSNDGEILSEELFISIIQ